MNLNDERTATVRISLFYADTAVAAAAGMKERECERRFDGQI